MEKDGGSCEEEPPDQIDKDEEDCGWALGRHGAVQGGPEGEDTRVGQDGEGGEKETVNEVGEDEQG